MKWGMGRWLPGHSWARSARHQMIKAVIGQLAAVVLRGREREVSEAETGARGGASGRDRAGRAWGAGYAHAPWCCRCRRGEGSGRDGRVRVGV